jgi:hypothetical protein
LAANSFTWSTFAGIFPLFGTQSKWDIQQRWPWRSISNSFHSPISVQWIGYTMGIVSAWIPHLSNVAFPVSEPFLTHGPNVR